jgi:hypothetical protein
MLIKRLLKSCIEISVMQMFEVSNEHTIRHIPGIVISWYAGFLNDASLRKLSNGDAEYVIWRQDD